MRRCGCEVHVRSQVMLCMEVTGPFFGPGANGRVPWEDLCQTDSPQGARLGWKMWKKC